MSGNYGYPNYNNYNRPPDPTQSGRPLPPAQGPQYGHGHQGYMRPPYPNAPPSGAYPYTQYAPQPPLYPTQGYTNDRTIDFAAYPSGQPVGSNQASLPPSVADQYSANTPHMPGYNSWNESKSVPTSQTFNKDDEERAALRVFDRFDQDRGGYLDLQEFMDALRALHLAISYHEALDCFVRCDVNEDGRISKDEFIRIYVSEKQRRPPMAFHQLGVNAPPPMNPQPQPPPPPPPPPPPHHHR